MVPDGYNRRFGHWSSTQILSFILLFTPLASQRKIPSLPFSFPTLSQGTWHFPQTAVVFIHYLLYLQQKQIEVRYPPAAFALKDTQSQNDYFQVIWLFTHILHIEENSP